MKRLLVVYHTQTGNTGRMAEAVLEGARSIEETETVLKRAGDAGVDDFLSCDGLVIGTPENFGYMAGMVKDFLDRVFYPAEGKVDAMPYAMFVSAGNDGTQAPFQIERILTGLRMRRVRDSIIARGAPDGTTLARCEELGATMAAGIAFGMF
jgi:multimeric flavodoxin WrbA